MSTSANVVLTNDAPTVGALTHPERAIAQVAPLSKDASPSLQKRDRTEKSKEAQKGKNRQCVPYLLAKLRTNPSASSKPEWEKLYRDAWAIYYIPSYIETILRRAQAYGINIWRLAQIILWFAQSLTIEKVHPL